MPSLPMKDYQRALGLNADGTAIHGNRKQLIRYVILKLAAIGHAHPVLADDSDFLPLAHDLLENFRERSRLLADHLCPPDRRIQDFVDRYLEGLNLNGATRLPWQTFVLDRHGLGRELSLPFDGDSVHNPLVSSYRLAKSGILHNPVRDRRTTKGVFHIVEGGLPIPADKIAVPKLVYGNLLHAALNPPVQMMRVPFTANLNPPAEIFVSLLIRPLVCPEVPGVYPEKTMEIRLFAPGSLVTNLDFVESIFGNSGDPTLPDNDAGLDIEHWTGHTGCIILAPHLTELTKKELGLPRFEDATERQRKQGMCYRSADEKYNDGQPFKATCRTDEGVMVTILADNYFGYCKKEVKTQISYAANLYGLAEEEHAGGALAFATYQLGDAFKGDAAEAKASGHTFDEALRCLGDRIDLTPEGHGIDRNHPDIIYVPEDVSIDLYAQRVAWATNGWQHEIQLLADKIYVLPNGYKIRMSKHPGSPTWSLVGTVAQGTFCHKPCTVSGGGKSEISKSIADSFLFGPIYIGNVNRELDMVEQLFARDYCDRVRPELRPNFTSEQLCHPLLHPQRSLGSVIKMLTPSREVFTDEYNAWLEGIPNGVRALVFVIKRFYKPEWGNRWREHFGVDIVNGEPGHEFKFGPRKLVGTYLRVGFAADGAWRTYKLRQDYRPADKVQMEDDITASIVVPISMLSHANLTDSHRKGSVKLSSNCEYRLFQRPDEAIVPGHDRQTEWDMTKPGLFCSNYEPLTPPQVQNIVRDAISFCQYTYTMQEHLRRLSTKTSGYVVLSAKPRVIDGKPSQNPRYLQLRPDIAQPRDRYLAEIGARLHRKLAPEMPVVFPVDAVLPGRRNNPPDDKAGIRSLAVYNPIHYQELPELFMDFVCSLTGKSPSTTGAGSEGALTKGPFNALRPSADLNAALISFILTGQAGFSTAAGYCGPAYRMDHDVSLLIPEIWCRLSPSERDPVFLIREGLLEKLEDFDHNGKRVLASRLGYRITNKFVHAYFGRVFDNPAVVFTQALLQPETQDIDSFVDGVNNIVEAQQRVALEYIEDGTVDDLCPPLRALLHMMAYGHYNGMKSDDPAFRAGFHRDALLGSEWYEERLLLKQQKDIALWRRHMSYLKAFLSRRSHASEAQRLDIIGRLQTAERNLHWVSSLAYLKSLHGTIGVNPDMVTSHSITNSMSPIPTLITEP